MGKAAPASCNVGSRLLGPKPARLLLATGLLAIV